MNETPPTARPVAITVICILGFIGAALAIPLIFSATARGIGAWYPPYLGLTTLIGLPFLVSRARSERINRWLTIGSGVLSLAFGIYLAYQIGIVDGLFTGDFHWDPA